MLGDGVVELYEAGVVDNSRKGIDKGKFVFNFVMGSKRLYDSCHRNEDYLLKPVDYVNDPAIIAENPSVVSINAALAVDFYGQVAADTIGVQAVLRSGRSGRLHQRCGNVSRWQGKSCHRNAVGSKKERWYADIQDFPDFVGRSGSYHFKT